MGLILPPSVAPRDARPDTRPSRTGTRAAPRLPVWPADNEIGG